MPRYEILKIDSYLGNHCPSCRNKLNFKPLGKKESTSAFFLTFSSGKFSCPNMVILKTGIYLGNHCPYSVNKLTTYTLTTYLVPQIRSTNNRFHLEAKLPWSYGYHLANHIAIYKSSANCEPLFHALALLSGIFEKFSLQGV